MKRKELYEYIREEIISELSLNESNNDTVIMNYSKWRTTAVD
jgi:hypothetical protein